MWLAAFEFIGICGAGIAAAWQFIKENAPALGVLIAAGSLLVAVINLSLHH